MTKEMINITTLYKYDVKRGNTVAWIGRRRDNEGSIATVRKMMKKNNILFTRMAKEVSGELFDINIVPKGKAQAMIKSSDPRMTTEKYGGYNKRSRAFFIVVEHRTDKGIVRSFEPVYLMHKAAFENNPTDYCRNILGLTEPRVIRKVKINSLLSLDGFRMHLSGANSETTLGLKDANQLVLEPSMVGYIKKVIKFNGRNREAAKFRKPLEKPERYKITQEKNCEVYDASSFSASLLNSEIRMIFSQNRRTSAPKDILRADSVNGRMVEKSRIMLYNKENGYVCKKTV